MRLRYPNSANSQGLAVGRTTRALWLTLLLIPSVAGVAAPATASVVYVDWAGGGDYLTIQEGVDAASAGDTVIVACGTYCERIWVVRDVYLRSLSGEPDCVMIDAEQQGRVCFCQNLGSTSTIEGMTFANGYVGQYIAGGGMRCDHCSHTVRDCVFADNSTECDGGGIDLSHSSLVIEDCSFVGNTAAIWGGAINFEYSRPHILRCDFVGNTALHGGAISCRQSSDALIEWCTLSGNTANYGGGIDCFSYSTCDVRNSTFWANTASLGSGMRVGVSTVALGNTVFAQGLSAAAIACLDGAVVLSCCDIFGNEGGDWVGCVADQLGVDDNICLDPLFCHEQNADQPLSLHTDSPCAPENSPCGLLIGACDVGCASTSACAVSWSALKTMYR